MNADAVAQLTRILQLSITPVALISGVGLLLLSMTNRLGRVIDRSRVVSRGDRPPDARAELRILFKRARLLQVAILLMAISIFLAVLMIAMLFAMFLMAATLDRVILLLFGGCLLCLVVSVACFLGDISLSIRWLHVSVGRLDEG